MAMAGRSVRLFALSRLFSLAGSLAVPAQLNLPELITPVAFERAKKRAVSEKYTETLPLETFLQRGGLLSGGPSTAAPPILDVRSPCEYVKGHIPGAINVPLFDDDERAEVGTLYKKVGHDAAVSRGLELVDARPHAAVHGKGGRGVPVEAERRLVDDGRRGEDAARRQAAGVCKEWHQAC